MSIEMNQIKTCKRCLYRSDHPLGLIINDDGLCSGCIIHEEKDTLDWDYKWDRLEKLVEPYRSLDTRLYDCVVPVTGGQDSYYIVHIVKEKLGLNPLLVSYNKYWNTPLGIKNLANLRIKFNCDIVLQNINPLSVKKIVKETLRKMGSIYWHCIAGQTVFPVQTAVRYKIPLIIWGAHQGMEQVGMFSHKHEVEMTRRYRKDHDLMGFEADDLVGHFNSISEQDIWQYRYPDDKSLNDIGVRGIYLNNYVRWDPKSQHESMIKMYGYKTSKFSRTFDCYDYVDCYNYMNLHDKIKFLKNGYSKVTDHATREIRHGRLRREYASELCRFYEKIPIKYDSLFNEWLGTKPNGLDFILSKNINTKYYKSYINPVVTDKINVKESDVGSVFLCNSSLNDDQEEGYITIGKGYS
mgnify:CR=1 FL=1